MMEETEDLVLQAEACLNQFPPQVDRALDFYKKAIEADDGNSSLLNSYGELLCTAGREQEALDAFNMSVKLAPTGDGPSKYLYLGQLTTGHAALQNFQIGIKCLEEAKANGYCSWGSSMVREPTF
eukprot:GHVN01065851.1.p1 GENE.GHVN01065851.1~~GHVN01065851.1.p1  ORF type:complete len:125 (+),score=19.75 GHVN01065851.1:407-781(+)